MCIHYGHEEVANIKKTDILSLKSNKRKIRPIKMSRLQGWYTGTYAEIVNMKHGHIDKNGFEDILTQFVLKFKGFK